jgi:hypothetical protein
MAIRRASERAQPFAVRNIHQRHPIRVVAVLYPPALRIGIGSIFVENSIGSF